MAEIEQQLLTAKAEEKVFSLLCFALFFNCFLVTIWKVFAGSTEEKEAEITKR